MRPYPIIRLRAALLAAGIPMDGVAINLDAQTARVDYQASATPAQVTQANAIIAGFDWSQAADDAYQASQVIDLSNIKSQAANALNTNATFTALSSPTQAQTLAQVKALTAQNTQIIKALLKLIG